MKFTIKRFFEHFLSKKQNKPSYETKTELQTTKNGITVAIKRIAFRQFYDSEWFIQVEKLDNKVFSCKIIRYDDETASSLECKLRSLKDLDEKTVATLDLRHNIYYD